MSKIKIVMPQVWSTGVYEVDRKIVEEEVGRSISDEEFFVFTNMITKLMNSVFFDTYEALVADLIEAEAVDN